MNNQNKIPQFGFGTYQITSQKDVDLIIEKGFKYGYRHFDSAVMYENENQLGKSIKKYQIPRDEIFITSKILPQDLTYQKTLNSVKQSLKNLQMDYIDMVLLHWPGASSIKNRQESWRALEQMVNEGKIKNIGVSNFLPRHIQSLDQFKIKPCVNQIELHPLYYENDTIQYCKNQNIIIEAYSPFAIYDKQLMENNYLKQLAAKYKKSVAQVILRWGVQQNFVVLPRSRNELHFKENIEIADFQLTEEEIIEIINLNCNYKTDWNPDSVQ